HSLVLPPSLNELIASLGTLPGIGPRSAERLALYLAQADSGPVRQLAQAILQAREKIRTCANCGSLTEQTPCALVVDPRRHGAVVCVVERPTDVLSIERSGSFRGRFHVLGGRISPLNGVGAEDLRIAELEQRLAVEPIREIILALGTDVEGDATSFYL